MLEVPQPSRAQRLAFTVMLATSGCSLIGLDELSEGSGGAAASSSADAASTATATVAATTSASTGGEGTGGVGGDGTGGQGGEGGTPEVCTGCYDADGVCVVGDTVATCGRDAGLCETCEVSSACEVVSCAAGGCAHETLPPGTPCDAGAGIGSGACDEDGACLEVAENCANGDDDDGNGLIDCADPACGSFTCLPEAPPLWLGPFFVYQGASLSCPVAAGSEGLPQFGTGFEADPVQCPDCGCTATCDVALEYASGPASTCDQANQSTELVPEVCTVVGTPGVDLKYAFRSTATMASCDTFSTGSLELPLASFTDRLTSCEPEIEGAGCDDDLKCVPRPPDVSGASARTCIAREGDRTCPDAFPDKQLASEALADNRSCTACECGDVRCAGDIQLSTQQDCQCPTCRTIRSDDADACGELQSKYISAYYKPETTCDAIGGAPDGTIDYAEPYTICCEP